MLRVKNNNVYMTRGSTNGLDINHWNSDGTPFVLPPVDRVSIHAIANIWFDGYSYHYDFFRMIDVAKIKFTKHIQYVDVYEGQEHRWYEVDNDTITINEYVTNIIVPEGVRIESIEYTDYVTKQTVYDDGILTVAVLDIRAGTYDSLVTQIYMNLMDLISSNGFTDLSDFGFNKFNTYYIADAQETTRLLEALEQNYEENGWISIGRVGNNFYHLATILKDGTKSYKLLPYQFAFTIPLAYSDTAHLGAKEYTYDVIVYQGIPKDTTAAVGDFPLKEVTWKYELIAPHKFIIGDSHNA